MKWKWKYQNFGELLRSPSMEAAMRGEADLIKTRAEGLSPTGSPRNGHYRDRFEISSGVAKTAEGRRAIARVTNTSIYALDVEYGNHGDHDKQRPGRHGRTGTSAHYPLTRALEG